MTGIVDTQLWADETFGNCELGDSRRTQRLVKVAQRIADHPAGSLPHQMHDWSELKAAYRLFDCDDVTLEGVARPHWEQTRRSATSQTLVVCDTTELNFGSPREGLGRTGNGYGRGFLLHTALMVDAATQSIVGVAGQTLHYRPLKKKGKKNSTQTLKGDRESQIWGRVIDDVGPPADEAQYVYVCDRGADNFEVMCHFEQQHSDWVVRAKRQRRNLLTPDGEKVSALDLIPELSLLGTYELELRARPGQAARTAQIEVRSTRVLMPVPHHKSPWVKSLDPEPIPMQWVQVKEVNAPDQVKPIEWLLWTSLPADTFEEAWQIIEHYESRWLIEEFHKSLKTGCQVKERQLQTADRLEPLTGLLSVTAVYLLRLKTLSKREPDRPAKQVVPRLWLEMLKAARPRLRRVHDLTVYGFYREVAKLGGFIGRKSDGEPGWITIWRGWEKLAMLVRGAQLAQSLKR